MDIAQPATYRRNTQSVDVSHTALYMDHTHKRDLNEEIKSNSSANDLCDIRRNDGGLCKNIESIVEPRRAMCFTHLREIHARH
jgi:hypothetical protein